MRVEEIEVEYFLTFGRKFKRKFLDSFNAMILGKWKSQPKRSNGSGKTNFVEIFKFLLYGKAREKFNDEIPNDNFNKSANLRGVFNCNGKKIDIRRTVNGSISTLKVKGWGRINKDDAQRKLNEEIGYSYEDFISTCYFEQGDIHQFMNSKSTEKMMMLERWLNIFLWDEYEKTCKQKKVEIENRIKVIEENVRKVKQLRLIFKELKEEKEKVEEKKCKLETEKKRAKEKINRLRKKMIENKIKPIDIKEEIRKLENELMKVGSENKLKIEKREVLVSIKDKKKKLKQISSLSKKVKNLRKGRNKLEYEIRHLNDEINERRIKIKKMEGIIESVEKNNVCPVDGEECNRISEIKISIKFLKKDLNQEHKQQGNAIDEVEKKISKRNGIDLEISNIKGLELNVEKIELKIELEKERIKKIKNKLEEISSIEKLKIEIQNTKQDKSEKKVMEDINEWEDDLIEIDDKIAKMHVMFGEIKSRIKSNRLQYNRVLKNKEKLKKLKKINKELSFCLYMFGKNGIRAWQLRSRIEEIESETNKILKELDSSLQIEIKVDRELRAWEKECVYCGREFPKGYSKRKCDSCGKDRRKKIKEEFDIKVNNLGKVRRFKAESGGNKILVSLAIRLSLVKIRQRITGHSIEMLFLDEIHGMLDKVNRGHIYKFLLSYAKKKLGFNQIFQISHIDDGDISSEKIQIIKHRKYSEIV